MADCGGIKVSRKGGGGGKETLSEFYLKFVQLSLKLRKGKDQILAGSRNGPSFTRHKGSFLVHEGSKASL